MATDRVINKVLITEEAQFDYEIMFGRQIPKADIKQESETYIDNRIGKGNLQGYYIRAKYYDETADQMLMLFFYKSWDSGTIIGFLLGLVLTIYLFYTGVAAWVICYIRRKGKGIINLPRCKHSSTVSGSYVASHST